jgi:hypothetical protein
LLGFWFGKKLPRIVQLLVFRSSGSGDHLLQPRWRSESEKKVQPKVQSLTPVRTHSEWGTGGQLSNHLRRASPVSPLVGSCQGSTGNRSVIRILFNLTFL